MVCVGLALAMAAAPGVASLPQTHTQSQQSHLTQHLQAQQQRAARQRQNALQSQQRQRSYQQREQATGNRLLRQQLQSNNAQQMRQQQQRQRDIDRQYPQLPPSQRAPAEPAHLPSPVSAGDRQDRSAVSPPHAPPASAGSSGR